MLRTMACQLFQHVWTTPGVSRAQPARLIASRQRSARSFAANPSHVKVTASGSDEKPRGREPAQTRQWDVETLLVKYQKGFINLNPEYQRGYVWDQKRASKLIESVFMGIYIPAVVLHEKEDNVYDVVDGKQRLTTLIFFSDPENFKSADGKLIKLQGLEDLEELNGKDWNDLDEKGPISKRSFMNGEVSLSIIPRTADAEIVFATYERINMGSMNLSTQQLRRAIFPGTYIKLLDELAMFQPLLDIRKDSARNTTEDDSELILRFFALQRSGHAAFRHPMKKFLNAELRAWKDLDPATVVNYRNLFKDSVTAAVVIFSKDDAFRVWDAKSGKFSKGTIDGISPYVWDTVMGVLAQRFVDIRTKAQRDKQQKLILAKAKPLKEAFVRLCSDSGDEARIFQENLQGKRATTTKAIRERYNTLSAVFGRILDDSRTFSKEDKASLFVPGMSCVLCHRPIDDLDDAEVDHKVPFSRGGATDLDNAQLVHRKCNRSKGNDDDE